MQDYLSLLPPYLYKKHLKTINGIKFTQREVEVTAYLLSGRSVKAISSFLPIAPRTVETHVRNIMLKTECNSRDALINFLEKSPQFSLLKEYSGALDLYESFEKSLKELGSQKDTHLEKSLILYGKICSPLKAELIEALSTHLTQLGLNISFKELSPDLIEKHLQVAPTPLIILTHGDQAGLQMLKDVTLLDLSDAKNYYLAFYLILKAIAPSVDIAQGEEGFVKKLEGTRSPSLVPYEVSEVETPSETHGFLKKVGPYKRLSTMAIVGLVGIVIGAWLYTSTSSESIRSDLVLPTETAMLQRPESLARIEDKFRASPKGIQTVALVGIGGAGKTTLARQFASQDKKIVVWEINAETHESLKSSFEKLAQSFAKTEEDKKILRAIQEEQDPKERDEQTTLFVKEHLKQQSPWLLIYDNVEQFSDIQTHFPHDLTNWGEGRVLVTTRDDNIRNNKHVNHVVPIGELKASQKLALFSKIMTQGEASSFTPAQEKEAKTFLEKIPPFPLDVSIAAYYLKATRVSYERYVKNLQEHDQEFEKTHESLARESGHYNKTRFNIIKLSLEKLLSEHKEFKDLLLFLCLVDSQNIPRALLEKYKESPLVDSFIRHLKKYSFIGEDQTSPADTSLLSMHRSTQQIALSYLVNLLDLEKNGTTFEPMAKALEAQLVAAIDSGNFESMSRNLPHGLAFLGHSKLVPDHIRGIIEGKLGGLYLALGEYNRAETLLQQSCERLKSGSPRQEREAWVLINLGIVKRDQDKFETALTLFNEGLEIYESHVPKNFNDVANVFYQLGILHGKIGKNEKAIEFLRKSLELYSKVCPKNCIEQPKVHAQLAEVYDNLAHYDKAIEHAEKAYKILTRDSAADQINIAVVQEYLGQIYRHKGNYKKAMQHLDACLRIYQNYLSNENVKVARIYVQLGVTLLDLGEAKKANTLFAAALSIYEKYGEEATVWVNAFLGESYRKLGNYKRSQEILEKSAKLYEELYSTHDKAYPWVFLRLGSLYTDLGYYEEARSLFYKCYELHEDGGDTLNYRKIWVLSHLGPVYIARQSPKKAAEVLESCLSHYKQTKDTDHPLVAWISGHLGTAYSMLGDHKRALSLLNYNLAQYESLYGKNHTETARVLTALGEAFLRANSLEQAESALTRGMGIFKENKHPDQYKVYEALAQLSDQRAIQLEEKGNLKDSQKEAKRAEEHLLQAITIVKETFPEDSPHRARLQSRIEELKTK